MNIESDLFLVAKVREAFYYWGLIGLYGSYSRGDQTPDSDIDIVYILRDGNKFGYFEYLALDEMLSGYFKKKVELVNYKYMNPIIKHKAEKEIIYA